VNNEKVTLMRGRFIRMAAGAYFLSYGLVIEAGSLPPEAAAYIGWIYYPYLLSIVALGFGIAWKVSRFSHSRSLQAAMMGIGGLFMVAVLYFVPWFIPFEYGDLRWGWSVGFNLAVKTAFKAAMIILGTALLVLGGQEKVRASMKGG
jgi:hypothetical protein